MSDWVEEGETAPDFTLPADDGRQVKLSDLRGKPVVLYFYPQDDTPGCTKEACAFRDRTQDLKAKGAGRIGGKGAMIVPVTASAARVIGNGVLVDPSASFLQPKLGYKRYEPVQG